MTMLAVLFFANLVIGGIFVWKFLFRSSLFLSAAVFLGAYALILFAVLAVKIPLNRFVINFPLVFLPFILFRLRPFPRLKLFSAPSNRVTYILLGLLAVMIVIGVMHIMKAPLFERDGLGIWLTKAKMIALDRTFRSDNFFNPWRIQDHPRYPLLLPLLEAAFMNQAGINEWTVKLVFVYIWILILGVLYENLINKSTRLPLIATVILTLIPAYYVMSDGSLHTGYADIPISLFYLATFVMLWDYFQTGEKKSAVGAGLTVAFSVFTKNEGLAFGLAAASVFFLTRKKISDATWFLTAAVLPLVPWFLTLIRLPDLYQEHYLNRIPVLLLRLRYLPLILKNAGLETLNVRHWGIFWILVVWFVVIYKPGFFRRCLLSIIGLTLAIYLGIYLLTTWDISFQMSVSFPRLLLQVVPSLVFILTPILDPDALDRVRREAII
jgi:hypothetical protein